jgi:hypothetical protein
MREETRKKLERALWMDRLKKVGIGLGIVALLGLVFAYENFDLMEQKIPVSGVIESIDPLVSKNANASDAWTVGVRLDDGQHVRVIEMKNRDPKIGERIQIVEHRHATGRVTHTLK